VTDKITANTATIKKGADDLRSQYEDLQVQLASLTQSQDVFNSLFK
jgi:hypothetical protein